jgi:hypothetical protein
MPWLSQGDRYNPYGLRDYMTAKYTNCSISYVSGCLCYWPGEHFQDAVHWCGSYLRAHSLEPH